MTCLEKLKIDIGCPVERGYLQDPEWCLTDNKSDACERCWNREIPEEPTLSEEKLKEAVNSMKDIPGVPMFERAQADMEKDMDEIVEIAVGLNPEIGWQELKGGLQSLKEEFGDPVKPRILDSGNRRQFESGAVRDIAEGKGRCDLLPLDIVATYIEEDNDTVDWVLMHMNNFQETGSMHYLYSAMLTFARKRGWDDYTMLLEVSKHFEEGARKYGDSNWRMGIPVRCYIDSATRHYIKWLRGDNDEPHDRAVCWNLMCGIWTCKHKPELNEYNRKANET